jgi:peptidoglycan/xylan/chitin deacetylase (PgdA/CDA1 family)
MNRAGITFGAHTLTHPNLNRLSGDQARGEVVRSKEIIEEALGEKIHTFAYPYGFHSAGVRALVSKNFKCACTTKLGLVHGRSDLGALERVEMYYLRTERLFPIMLSRAFSLYLLLRGFPRRIRHLITGKAP